jgi:hypothetical protein
VQRKLHVTEAAVSFTLLPKLKSDSKICLMNEQRYRWQAAYGAVVAESDPALIPVKLYAALSECEQRRFSPVDADEEKALREAEEVLRMLRDERFDPDVQ